MPERLRLIAAVALLGYGLLAVGVGAGANLIAWYTAWSYARSGEAERMQRQIEEASADDDAAGSRF